MAVMFEVRICLSCDRESARHDYVKGDGCADFEDSTKNGARRQAEKAGWILAIEGKSERYPRGREVAYCPECVNRKLTAQQQEM